MGGSTKRVRRGVTLLLLALGLSVVAVAPAQAANQEGKIKPLNPRVTVKVPDIQIASEGGLYTALEKGYFDEAGIDIQLIPVVNSSDQVALLATGDLSIGVGAPSPTFFNAVNRGIDLKYVCTWATQDKGDGILGLYVRKELLDSGQIKSIADLKGRRVALTSVAEPFQLTKMLEAADMTIDDVEPVALPVTDMVAAFANGSIDAGLILEPFGIQAEARGYAGRLMPAGDFYQGPATFVTSGPAFTRTNPEALPKFLAAFLKGQREYNNAFYGDGTNKADIVNILTKYTRAKDPAQYVALEAKKALPRIEPDCTLPTKKAINEVEDVFITAGSMTERVKVSEMFDPKPAAAALKIIGKSTDAKSSTSTSTTAAK